LPRSGDFSGAAHFTPPHYKGRKLQQRRFDWVTFQSLNRKRHNDKELSKAAELYSYVGGLPLAIAEIAGFVEMHLCSLAELKWIMESAAELWLSSAGSRPWQYSQTLSTMFEITLDHLPVEERMFLHVIAFLNPDGIPEFLFFQGHPGKDVLPWSTPIQ
jgi:hypothetical protein